MLISCCGYLLFVLCLLPVASIEEESTSRCSNEVVHDHQKFSSPPKSMLQSHMAGSVQGHAAGSARDGSKQDLLTIATALMLSVGENVFHTETRSSQVGLSSLRSALSSFGLLTGVYIFVFIVASSAFPLVYAYNVLTGKALVKDTSQLGGAKWATIAWKVTTEDAAKYIGVDGAMFLEFIDMAIIVCSAICLPMALIVAPMNFCYGEGSEKDMLFKADERNLRKDHWLYWRDALIVWYVVILVQYCIGQSHNKFRRLRAEWLRKMPPPQSHTILIQNLADELCSEEALKSYMTKVFAEDAVESIFVVRTEDVPDAPYTKNGFVTFRRRRDMEVALKLCMDGSAHHDVNVITAPPHPVDVEYDVLQQEDANPVSKTMKGHAVIICLFIAYLPLVFLVALVTSLQVLIKWSPYFANFCQSFPTFVSLWEGVIGPAALTLLPSFIPTILISIIRDYFALPSVSWCQSMLERWYFYFQVTFTLIIFSFSTNVFELYSMMITQPESVLSELLPAFQRVSFFYMLFILADVTTHASALCRIFNLLKFIWYRRNNTEEEAYKLSEPEDQDYQGIGSRSARLTLILVITLVYCTVETFIALMALVDFLICRVVYSYLMLFAESRKQDSGGWIWISQLKQVQFGLFLYVSLMTGIIFKNSASAPIHAPGYLACLAYSQLFKFYFERLELERLPCEEVVELDEHGKQLDLSGSYSQPKSNAEQPEAQCS